MTGANEETDGANGSIGEAPSGSATAPDSTGPIEAEGGALPADDWPDELPRWDDEYLNRVARRLAPHYDLERDYAVDGERFPMYGELRIQHQRHVLHPSVTFAEHRTQEHVFVCEIDRPTVGDLTALGALGDRLAADRVDADEDHYSTDFTFAIVADAIADDVADFVEGYSNRTLLRGGLRGHTEVNLIAVVPDAETSVASASADVEQAFRVWESIDPDEPGLLGRVLSWVAR
ncbi:hypothetical protein [Halovivax limisalsi]|uniref:hypothetical protein n=1 Tax=Halovivax limisalsi TaxID=1453760 RepID=UPI001FFD368A|nr:hypothetical protein [Halovivax limisalsi]